MSVIITERFGKVFYSMKLLAQEAWPEIAEQEEFRVSLESIA